MKCVDDSIHVQFSESRIAPRLSLMHYRRFYFVHSTIIVAFLAWGMSRNGGNRKYIPVVPNELRSLLVISQQSSNLSSNEGEMGSCSRAYVNVHSSNIEEDLAAVCCIDDRIQVSDEEKYRSNLCHPRVPILRLPPHRVPFALRLNRPVEAWVFPLLPILIRLLYQLVVLIHTAVSRHRGNQEISPFSSCSQSIKTTLRRLGFYFLVLNFRGWCLYIGANALEDYVILPWLTGYTVASPFRTDSMSDVVHDLYSSTESSCWYQDLLKAHHKNATENDWDQECYGRSFDFSDHVVLFLAHYLPIFVMEMLIYCAFPFWGTAANENATTHRSWAHVVSRGAIWNAFHTFLFFYMHLLIFQALYQTVTYFHTPAETLVGFGISMILQAPIIHLMCTERSYWIKKYIGLSCDEQVRLFEKGD